MLIDWFTVAAQALNFLILAWLLKRFLYQPILQAIDAREKRIALALADADRKMAEAEQERDAFQIKNEEFARQRDALLIQAVKEAKAERQRLLDAARRAADELSAKRRETLKKRCPQPESGTSAPDPAGGLRHCTSGADRSGRDQSGRASDRGLHTTLART